MIKLGSPLCCLLLGLCAVVLIRPASAEADSVETLFQDGNNAFWNGQFEKASKTYNKLEALGVRSAGLSFNLATAEARNKRLGSAIRHYERVLARDPGHEDAIYNLAVIRDFIARRASEAGRDADLVPSAGPWRAVLDRFSPNSAAITFLLLYLFFFSMLVGRRFIKTEMPRLTMGVLAGIFLLLCFGIGAVTLGKWNQETNLHEAVVMSKDTLNIMEGPGNEGKRFALEEGSRIIIIESREDWVKIRDDQGRDGWAPTNQIGEI